MTISEAIKYLDQLRALHGDVEVVTDCEYCQRSTRPTTVVAVRETIKVSLK